MADKIDNMVILIKDEESYAACGMYSETHGLSGPTLLSIAIPSMKANNPALSMVRLMTVAAQSGLKKVSVMRLPNGDEDLEDYSQGDAGVIIYDCGTGEVEYYGGYFDRRLQNNPEYVDKVPMPPVELPVPPI